MHAFVNPYSCNVMIKVETPAPESTRDVPAAPPNAAYRELARSADQEFREWLRRRAERRAHARRAHRAERTPVADGSPDIPD